MSDHIIMNIWVVKVFFVQETGIKTILVEKKCKKAKWLSGEDLQIAVKRRGERQRRKEKI